MKDKIKDIFNKINTLIETECSDKEYQYFKFRNADVPVRKEKVLFDLFPLGMPTEFNIDIFERFIVESKKEAENYNNSELVVGERYYNKSIILYYYETEQEVFERLSLGYNCLIDEIKHKKEEEYKKFIKTMERNFDYDYIKRYLEIKKMELRIKKLKRILDEKSYIR
jgi:hypothetical protein